MLGCRFWCVGLLFLTLQVLLPVKASVEVPYYNFSIDVDRLAGTPASVEALNAAITDGARLVSREGHFWRQDGLARVRLFGVNLSFSGNFPELDEAPILARRLKVLGFNAVRLHHLDTTPSRRNPPYSILVPGPFPSFNDEAIQRLRGLIQALAKEGLYVNLNLHVGYRFQPAVDEVPFYEPARMARALAAPIVVFHPRMIALQEVYAQQLIERLGLRGNPALAMVEINNESSLLAAWQRREWQDAIPGEYGTLLRGLWVEWLTARYGSLAAACTAWGGCDSVTRAGDMPQPARRSAQASTTLEALQDKLKTRMSGWLGVVPGKEALSDKPEPEVARIRDFMRFLAATDQRYYDRMSRVVKQAAGFNVLVTGTQMNYGGVLNLTSHAGMDYIDEHFYIDHPDFLNGSSDIRNWRIWNVSLTGRYMDRLLQLSFLRDASKPFVVSELNHPYPSLPAAEFMPIVSAFAALQDWDGLFFYDYDAGRRNLAAPAAFALRGDWGKYVTIGQSARLFRTAEVAALNETAIMPFNEAAQAAVAATGEKGAHAGVMQARFAVMPAHAWRYQMGIDTQGLAVPPTLASITSPEGMPTDSVLYDRQRGVLEILSPTTLGYFGAQPGGASMRGGLNVDFSLTKPYHAAVMLSSLDGKDVAHSQSLLLTLGSASVGSQPGSQPPRPKSFVRHPSGDSSWTLEPDPLHPSALSGSRDAQGPVWLSRNQGRVSWPTLAKRAVVYPLDGAGRRMAPLPPARTQFVDGRLEIAVQMRREETSPWYEIILNP